MSINSLGGSTVHGQLDLNRLRHECVCGENPVDYLTAHIMRNPTQIALSPLTGAPGVGKGTFVEVVTRLTQFDEHGNIAHFNPVGFITTSKLAHFHEKENGPLGEHFLRVNSSELQESAQNIPSDPMIRAIILRIGELMVERRPIICIDDCCRDSEQVGMLGRLVRAGVPVHIVNRPMGLMNALDRARIRREKARARGDVPRKDDEVSVFLRRYRNQYQRVWKAALNEFRILYKGQVQDFHFGEEDIFAIVRWWIDKVPFPQGVPDSYRAVLRSRFDDEAHPARLYLKDELSDVSAN